MDNSKAQPQLLVRIWESIFSGGEGPGMTKLVIVLATFLLGGGLLFAFLTR